MTRCKQGSKQFHTASPPRPKQQDQRRGADARLSPFTWNDRTGRVEMVRRGHSECNKEILCTTAERRSVRQETDFKHSEVQNFFSQPNAPPPSAFFQSVVWIAVRTTTQRLNYVRFQKEWTIVSAMRGLGVLRVHDPRRDVLSAPALSQRLRSIVNRLSDSSRFPP